MGLFDIFRGQFIDVIEWENEDPSVLVHRFDRHNNEIKMGAKLIVRPGQMAVFVNEGQIADRFTPGTYTLKTANMPILTTLLSLPYNFESPFKAEVYFIRTTEQLDRKWGTATPVMMRDKDFGIVRLRARGNYSYKVGCSDEMITRFVGARADFTGAEVEGQMQTSVVSKISDALGELQIPALDLSAQYDEISMAAKGRLDDTFSRLGFELCSFTIESISLPDEVNATLDKRTQVGALSGVMNEFTQMQAAEAMRDAASNPGGSGNMMGVMMGAQLGGMSGNAINQAMTPPPPPAAPVAPAAPPPLPSPAAYFVGINGQQTGPFTLQDLQNKIASGEINGATLVWKNGMPAWQAASTVAELAGLFPPPMP